MRIQKTQKIQEVERREKLTKRELMDLDANTLRELKAFCYKKVRKGLDASSTKILRENIDALCKGLSRGGTVYEVHEESSSSSNNFRAVRGTDVRVRRRF